MATKDWKKLRNNLMWSNKKTRRLIGVVRMSFQKNYIVTTVIGHWDNKSTDIGKFKTKSAAINFAKQYMRSH